MKKENRPYVGSILRIEAAAIIPYTSSGSVEHNRGRSAPPAQRRSARRPQWSEVGTDREACDVSTGLLVRGLDRLDWVKLPVPRGRVAKQLLTLRVRLQCVYGVGDCCGHTTPV